jgi:hypothetical protein
MRNPQDRRIQTLRRAAAQGDPEASEELASIYGRHGGQLTLWSDGYFRCEEGSRRLFAWARMGRYRIDEENPTMLSGGELVPRYRTSGPPFVEFRCMDWECDRPGMISWQFVPAAITAEVGRNLYQRFGLAYDVGRVFGAHQGNVEWWGANPVELDTRCVLSVTNTASGTMVGSLVVERSEIGFDNEWMTIVEGVAPPITTVEDLADWVLPYLQDHVRPRVLPRENPRPGDRDLRRMIREGDERAVREAWRRGEILQGPPHDHPARMTLAQFTDEWIDRRLDPLVTRQLEWLEECLDDPTMSERACWDFVQTEESDEYYSIYEQVAAHLGPASWNIEPYNAQRPEEPTDRVTSRVHGRLYDLVRERWENQ